MNIVEAHVQANKQVIVKKQRHFLFVFLAQLLVSAVLIFGVFAGRIFNIKGYQKVEQVAKQVVSFNIIEAIEEWLKFD